MNSQDGNFHEPVDKISADHQLTIEQVNMNVPPKDLLDSEIVRLRASLTASRKSLDDLMSEIADQVDIIKQARGRNGPRAVWIQYTKILQTLLENGDKKLNSFTECTDLLLQRLEMLLLRLETSNPEEHKKVEMVRNNLVGNARLYKGMFRKLRVQYEDLLSVL